MYNGVRKILVVYILNEKKHTNSPCKLNAKVVNVKADDKFSYLYH
jgi:hypothetical protein